MMDTKYCPRCSEDHPLSAFKLKKNGKYDSWCKESRDAYMRDYSRRKYAPRKAEVAQKREKAAQARSKTCTVCKEERPLEAFSERYDRPGKLRAECDTCFKAKAKERNRAYALINSERLAEYRRQYQRAHPGYNEGSHRRRRALLKGGRTEPYKTEEIWGRDNGICWICKQAIDLSIKWPDPMSCTIDHLHPISKKGPDAPNNVRVAHHRCNREKWHEYEPPFYDWSIDWLDPGEARRLMTEHHYLHRPPSTSFAFGLYRSGTKAPVAVVTFGTPSSFRTAKSICPSDPKLVLELNRLWVAPGTEHGATSWFVSRVLKLLPPRIIVSYADASIVDERNGRHHNGSVYRALNFNYAGLTRPRKEWRMPGKSRNVGKVSGAILSEVTPKYRYWTVTGNKRDKRRLRSLSRWPTLSWLE